MRQVVIANTLRFEVTSYGGGLSYLFKHKAKNLEIFFQGDDAKRFHDEWEAYEMQHPNHLHDIILGLLWDDYSDIAQPCES